MHKKIRKCESGQAIIEFLFMGVILLFLMFSIIEISRLMVFKNILQISASDLAREIALFDLDFRRQGKISNKDGWILLENKEMIRNFSEKIDKSLRKVSSSLVSFDKRKGEEDKTILSLSEENIRIFVRFLNENNEKDGHKLPGGVYIKVNACLPVLFSGYFRRFSQRFVSNEKEDVEIGRSLLISSNEREREGKDRSCSGEFLSFSHGAPLFWFRVRAAAYSPWPASSMIFLHGMPFPEKMKGIGLKNWKNSILFLEKGKIGGFFYELP